MQVCTKEQGTRAKGKSYINKSKSHTNKLGIEIFKKLFSGQGFVSLRSIQSVCTTPQDVLCPDGSLSRSDRETNSLLTLQEKMKKASTEYVGIGDTFPVKFSIIFLS